MIAAKTYDVTKYLVLRTRVRVGHQSPGYKPSSFRRRWYVEITDLIRSTIPLTTRTAP